ncbi:T9SS type A sorting domain-containing protein [bacterium]|nr:T9SS type A sorting domain-containing protein [bacterium]
MKKNVFALLSVLALISTAGAQSFIEITEGGWGEGRDFARPCFADIDNDGLLDLIVGDRNGTLEHLEQSAPGSFLFVSLTKTFNNIHLASDPAPRMKDIDNDGLLDLLIGDYSGTLHHYEQNAPGDTGFSLVSEAFNGIQVGRISTPSFTDLDHDGLIDLIVGEEDGNLNHYEQDHENSYDFSLITESLGGIDIGFISTPAFADLDGDGLLELLVGQNTGAIHYFKQSGPGSATFDFVTSQYIDIPIWQPCPVFVDLNDNGLLDLMIGDLSGFVWYYEQPSAASDRVVLITQNVLPGHDFGSNVNPFILDIDQNDKMDLIVGTANGTIVHLEQDSSGSSFFTVVTDSFNNIQLGGGHACPVFADLDRNGLLNLIIGRSNGRLEHYEQASEYSLIFNENSEPFNGLDVGEFSKPCFSDLDHDGLWDMLVGNGDGALFHYEQAEMNSLHFNLTTEAFNGILVPHMVRLCITDLQKDGQLDLIIGNSSGCLHHYEQGLQDPMLFSLVTETFADIQIGNSVSPYFGDVDGDGLDDLLIGERYGGVYYYRRKDQTGVPDHHPIIAETHHFELKPNYPNPFNPKTHIVFYLPKTASVEIGIYDLAGKKVETLLHGWSRPGYHYLTWDASEYSSGVYFIKASSGSSGQLQRCLLLK